jgi:ATPase subunit of ABC transporter with duplicated ATPase domains
VCFSVQSTLINLLQGKLTPQVGYIRVNPQLRVGIFTQHHMDSLDLSLSPIQNMALRWPLVNEVRSFRVALLHSLQTAFVGHRLRL